MKGRASITILCANQNDANAVRDDLLAWIQARPDRWLIEGYEPFATLIRNQWTVTADCGFTTRAGADALLARVQQRWSNGPIANRVLAGSSVSLHNCSHDDGIGLCTVDVTAVK